MTDNTLRKKIMSMAHNRTDSTSYIMSVGYEQGINSITALAVRHRGKAFRYMQDDLVSLCEDRTTGYKATAYCENFAINFSFIIEANMLSNITQEEYEDYLSSRNFYDRS